MRNAIIIGSGSYAPEQIVPNSFFNSILGTDVDSWLRELVQISERRWCQDEESVADLIEKACQAAMDDAGITAGMVDLLIIGTDTPEYISPATASVIQHRMKMINAATFDVNAACAGFVTALDIGARYIRTDEDYKHVMVVGAYTMSKHLDLTDKKTVTLFADGAAAIVLAAEDKPGKGFLAGKLQADGQYCEAMGIYGGGSKYPVTHDLIDAKKHKLQFVKKIPGEVNPDVWTKLVHDICHKANIAVTDIDHYFFTQININSIFETMDRLGQPREKAATIMHHFGYTGSACLPMAFDQWKKKGKLRPGDTVLFVGSGGGLAFGVCLFKL